VRFTAKNCQNLYVTFQIHTPSSFPGEKSRAMLAPCSQFCALRATSAVTATALITSRRRVISVSGLCRSRPRGRISTRTLRAGLRVVLGSRAGEILAAVQIAMIAGLLYTALRDAVLITQHWSKVSSLCSHPRRQRTTLATREDLRSPPHEGTCIPLM